MDALTFLKQEHRSIDALLKEYEQAGEKAKRKKKKIVKQIVDDLSLHADVEEQVFYPAVQQAAKEPPIVMKAMEEHEVLKQLMRDLQQMEPEEERFEPKVAVLADVLRHHFEEEEGEMWPLLQKAVSKQQLEDLGTRVEEGKKAIASPKDYLKLG